MLWMLLTPQPLDKRKKKYVELFVGLVAFFMEYQVQ